MRQNCPIKDERVDYVVSTFGLKNFDRRQLAKLAQQVARVLPPGGVIAFLEISEPKPRLLTLPYLAHINYLNPLIGRLALGIPITTGCSVCTRSHSVTAALPSPVLLMHNLRYTSTRSLSGMRRVLRGASRSRTQGNKNIDRSGGPSVFWMQCRWPPRNDVGRSATRGLLCNGSFGF
jgi:SAM-dependent methyltransferase